MSEKLLNEDQKLDELLEREWDYGLESVPEMSTFFGETKYNDKLSDISFKAIEKNYKHDLDLKKELESFDTEKLSETNKLNYQLFMNKVNSDIKEFEFRGYLMPLNQMYGIQNDFNRIVLMMPFKNEKDFSNYLSRLKAFPKYIDQVIDLLKKGSEEGYIVSKAAIANVPHQIMGQLPENYKESSYYTLLDNSNYKVSENLRNEIENSIQNDLYSSFNKLHKYLSDEYIPNCRDTYGLNSIPNGEEYYNHKLKQMTTTDLTAKEIHDIGLKEVERIHGEIRVLIEKIGFNGSYEEFLEFLRTDKQFYFDEADILMMSYRDVAKRIDKELPRFFKVLPRLPYGIDEIPAHQAPSYPTAYYMPSDMGMTRAGIFYANTSQLETRPKYEIEALTLHEAVPGHHLQLSLSLELEGLPKFRKLSMGTFTGYVEGWGLYSEKLGAEMGFYKDPYSKFGQLSFEMWRACRLVVDTGLHAFNWSREKCIKYLQENTGKSEPAARVEVDRYISIPGQATAYKIGEIKILELREKFERTYGDNFDIKEFHDVILRNGPLPLTVLENYVEEHLKSKVA